MVIILHLISIYLQYTACALYVHHIGDKVIGTLITQDTGNGTITEDHVEPRDSKLKPLQGMWAQG